jgi:hypothetical protein
LAQADKRCGETVNRAPVASAPNKSVAPYPLAVWRKTVFSAAGMLAGIDQLARG